MIFSSKKIKIDDRAGLQVGNTEVERVESFCYLGVHLDEHLKFEKQTNHTIRKVSDKLYQLRKVRQYLTHKAALLIYKNMILPILEYGDIYMTSASKENKKKLQTLQNKALKCALNKQPRYDTKELHKEAKISKLKTRRKIT